MSKNSGLAELALYGVILALPTLAAFVFHVDRAMTFFDLYLWVIAGGVFIYAVSMGYDLFLRLIRTRGETKTFQN